MRVAGVTPWTWWLNDASGARLSARLEALFHVDVRLDVSHALVELPGALVVAENVQADRRDVVRAAPLFEGQQRRGAEAFAAPIGIHLDVEDECVVRLPVRGDPQDASLFTSRVDHGPQLVSVGVESVR